MLIEVILGTSLVVAWSVLEWVWFRPKRLERLLNQQGIRGNPYKLFHGDMKEIRAQRARAGSQPMDSLSHDFFPRVRPFPHQTIRKYGKNCLMWEGPNPVVNIGEVELAREVLTRYGEFTKPIANPVAALIVRGLISHEGQKWAQHRKLIDPAFHMEKLKLMVSAFYTSGSEMIKLWEQKVSNSEREIDVSDYLPKFAADSISRAAFGSSFEEGKMIFELIKEQVNVTGLIAQSVYFPGLRFLPTKNNLKMTGLDKEIKSLITGIVEKRKQGSGEKDDLLGLLMVSNLQSGTSKQKIRVTTQEMIDECKLFYVAGQETTSTLLIWTLIMLSKHQEWQSKAREEVLETFGQGKPEFDGLNRLKTMNLIFDEVLRLYPPAMDLRRRVTEENTKLGKMALPRGAIINMPTLYIHHDTEVWGEDAKEFKPERFLKAGSKASFLAFGWGPRVCIGSNFALAEAKTVLSMILQRFRFELSPSYVHAPGSYSLLRPQFGAPITFHYLKEDGGNRKMSFALV